MGCSAENFRIPDVKYTAQKGFSMFWKLQMADELASQKIFKLQADNVPGPGMCAQEPMCTRFTCIGMQKSVNTFYACQQWVDEEGFKAHNGHPA